MIEAAQEVAASPAAVNSLPRPYYEHDGITIYHGDCRVIAPQLGHFDLLLTDPPYGIGFAAQPTNYQRAKGHKPASWDDEAVAFWSIEMMRAKTASQIIWGGNYYPLPPSRCWLTWYKPDAPPSMGNVEFAWTGFNQNCRQISQSISATNAERLGHPTQKPLRVISFALQQAGPVSTVLDPWAGSGTTGRVCKDAGVACVQIEREERYCEIAAKRLAQGVLL